MDAMIFAAGLGTRLRPYTDTRPKALVEVGGITLLEIAIRRLKKAGVQRIIINVHHFADQILDFLVRNNHFGLEIATSDERAKLLDTGGGLKKAASFFDPNQPFIVCNADIISNLDYAAMLAAHTHNKAAATLAVQQRQSSRCLLFDDDDVLCGWQNNLTHAQRIARETTEPPKQYAFSGIQIVSPSFLATAPEGDVFSMIDWYLAAAAEGQRVVAWPHPDAWILDVGKPDALQKAATLLPSLL